MLVLLFLLFMKSLQCTVISNNTDYKKINPHNEIYLLYFHIIIET